MSPKSHALDEFCPKEAFKEKFVNPLDASNRYAEIIMNERVGKIDVITDQKSIYIYWEKLVDQNKGKTL